MSTKVCSICDQARPTEDYSGAQLKKKGKRVCKHCINEVDPNVQASTAAANATAIAASAAAAAPAAAASSSSSAPPAPLPKGTVIPSVALPSLASGTYPVNTHFPSTAPIAREQDISYYNYSSESQLPLMTKLIEQALSEPYSVFTYRYFVNYWPELTFMAMSGSQCIGCIICRLEIDRVGQARGYIAMLAVSTLYRNLKIGSRLVEFVIEGMRKSKADLVVLEAEVTNKGALALYEKLGFVREHRLIKYYLSGSDAFRLKLWLKPSPVFLQEDQHEPQLEKLKKNLEAMKLQVNGKK